MMPAAQVASKQSLNEVNILQPKTIPVFQQQAAPGQIVVAKNGPATEAAVLKEAAPLAANASILDETKVSLATASPVFTGRAGEQIVVSKKEPLMQATVLQAAASPAEDVQGLNGTAKLQVTASPVFPGREAEQVIVADKGQGVGAAVPLKEAASLMADIPSSHADNNLQAKVSPVSSGPEAEQAVVVEKGWGTVAALPREAAPVTNTSGLNQSQTLQPKAPVVSGREAEQVVAAEKGPGLPSTPEAALQVAKTQSLDDAQNLQAKASPVTSGREAEEPAVPEQGLGAKSALLQKAAPLAANAQSLNDVKTPQAVTEQVPEPSLVAKNVPAPNPAALKDAAALQAKTQSPEEAKNLQAKASPVVSGREAEQAVVVEKGPGMDSAAQDKAVQATPAITDGPQNADLKSSTVQPVASGAQERVQQELAASDGLVKAPAGAGLKVASSPMAQAVTEAAEAASQPDRFAQVPTDTKGPRAAMGFHGTYAAVRGVTEQSEGKQAAPVEEVGTKTASTAGTAKFVPFQGSAGQTAFSDSDKKGHPEQKAQAGASAPVQPQGVGMPIEPAATEAPLAEAKPVNLKSALHESILSQIKDGVVTQDSKGNGQMSIRLNPGELGELKIQVRMEDNKLHVEVHADNRMVKDLLMSNLDSLKDSLTCKNFTMEGFDVSTGGGSQNPLPEQKENPRQQSFLRSARAGAYPDQGEETKVNYLTGEVNNLLDVRF